jgi:hypothetical protein
MTASFRGKILVRGEPGLPIAVPQPIRQIMRQRLKW